MNSGPVLLMHCNHSLGIGHIARSLALISELKKRFNVTLLSGGVFPECISVPGDINFIQLPALRNNADEKMVDSEGNSNVSGMMHERRDIVMQTFLHIKPEVIITEYFPFGKREFLWELLPVLTLTKQMKNKPLIFSSLRDIMEPTSVNVQRHIDFTSKICNTYYDGVFLHADPAICKLEDTFPYQGIIKIPLHYTGFVHATADSEIAMVETKDTVVASFGGGAVGYKLAKKIVEAYKTYGFGEGTKLKLITGPFLPAEEFEKLAEAVESNTSIELVKQVNNLTNELKKSRASISQCGYNTAMDILRSGVPAMVVPFKNETNCEQVIRASKLDELSLARHVEIDIDTREFAEQVRATISFKPKQGNVNLDGANYTTELLMAIHKEKTTVLVV